MAEDVLLIDDPAPKIRRLTLNRPDKRNALDDDLRRALFEALRAGDRASDVSVMIVRGAGSCFSAGYDLSKPNRPVERAMAYQDGWWARHVVNNWSAVPTVAETCDVEPAEPGERRRIAATERPQSVGAADRGRNLRR